MKVFVKALATGRSFQVEVEASDTVEALKVQIEATEGSPTCQQRLICKGKNLKDGETLAASGLPHPGATVHLVLCLASSISITVRSMAGKSVQLPVKPSDKVSDVLTLLQGLQLTGQSNSCLSLQGQRLAEDAVLGKIPIPNNANLRLILLPLDYRSEEAGSRAEEQDRIRVYGDLGTLYARCGGIFGIAGFVDRCMDKWMADATLNSNDAVATWHARAQRCGFKFLVTQLMGYLTSGPHRYTGRPIAEAHKHLNISPAEWDIFMDLFKGVCSEFALPSGDAEDLAAILTSMEQDCVIHTGEYVPPNPGPVKHDDRSLYGGIGGVYPLALFADRLVDALLADKRVKIPVDGQRRNEASLKYLFTEVVCNIAGGPEIITSTQLPETRLLLTGRSFFYLLDAAKTASDHFESKMHRAELIKRLHEAQHLIVDPARPVRVSEALRARQKDVEALGHRAGMELLYVPGGGLVKLDFSASEEQIQTVQIGLAELGFKAVEKTRVKTAGEAAAGNMLSNATIAARYAAPGAFVAARKRVHGDPQTLYGRGGGVFGLAKLADKLMDHWMADPILNANRNVANWHQSQQRCGFKFLVTQIFGYLTGGPQRYTGQPMDIAHKHLGISSHQWDAFMSGLDTVFRHLNMDAATHKELRGIVATFRKQVIVEEGEQTPADPGLCRKAPDGNSLYAQVGGVYPLSHFVDILVDQCIALNLGISWDRADEVKGKRIPAGLKYLVTELVCSGAGGPEVVTSRGFEDAKLGVPVEAWQTFVRIAAEAATTVWNSSAITDCILCLFEELKTEICIGLAKEEESAEVVKRRRLREAGYTHAETTAALTRCQGDAEEALALLVSGWTPHRLQMPESSASSSTQLRCPFSGMMAGDGKHACPFSAGAATPAVSLAPGVQRAGRVLGSVLQDELDDLLNEDPDLSCPITLMLFFEPVIASDGCVYEKAAIEELLRTQGLSPVTHKPLSHELVPALEIKCRLLTFMKQRCEQLCHFTTQAMQQEELSMAKAACERLGDYLAILADEAAPTLQVYQQICRQLGLSPALPVAAARLHRLLGQQVQQANADTVCKKEARTATVSKSVVFTVDVSGSMRGDRIEKARENLLKIFDDYIEDEDQLAMITFDHATAVQFELQNVGGNRATLRETASRACRVAGGTAFYDALINTVRILETPDDANPNPQWIIALTDGIDQHSQNSIDQALKTIKGSARKPNLIIVGIQLAHHVKPLMERLASATDQSIFIDASGGLESLDDAFQQVAELICE